MLSNRTVDLLTALERVGSLDELWSTSAQYFEQIGATHSIYTYIQQDNPVLTRCWTSLPRDWCERYLDEQYHNVDPFYRYCCTSFAPVGTGPDYLDDHDYLSKDERRVVLEGGETGFRSGFSSPVRLLGNSGFGGWNFGSDLPRPKFEAYLEHYGRDLRLAGFYIHEYAGRLLREAKVASRKKPILSARERECLLWLCRGIRNAEIANRMGIAVVTVDMHLKNARSKLNAATREEALAKAILGKHIAP